MALLLPLLLLSSLSLLEGYALYNLVPFSHDSLFRILPAYTIIMFDHDVVEVKFQRSKHIDTTDTGL